jgi:hypothetical protein
LQNDSGVFFPVNPVGFSYGKGENNCLLRFNRTKQAWFLRLILSFLPILLSNKEETGDFGLLQNKAGVFFPVMSWNFACFSFGKGGNN